jgi:hypothetical protein
MLCKDKNKNGGFSDLDYLHEIDDDEENLQRGGGDWHVQRRETLEQLGFER